MKNPNPAHSTTEAPPKPGLFQRIWTKLDNKVKEKAETKAKDSCCSGKDKGGKCC